MNTDTSNTTTNTLAPHALLQAIGELLGIGADARTEGVIRMNIENLRRRADCLAAVERTFFMVTVPADEDEDGEGATMEQCALNWGAEPAEYVEQFRAALAAATAAQPDECARPDIIERLTYHAHERDDLTLDDCLDVLATGWTRVHGRSERHLVLQILALLAGAPVAAATAAQPAIPPGFALVPIEPTEAMHNAARDWSATKYGKPIGIEASAGCWGAMVKAAGATGASNG